MSSVALLALHPSCNFITSSLSISLPSLGSGFPKSLGSCLHHFSKLLKYYELLVKTGPCCPVPRACIRLFYPQPHSSYLLKQLWILGNLHELILKMAFIYLKYQISSVLVFPPSLSRLLVYIILFPDLVASFHWFHLFSSMREAGLTEKAIRGQGHPEIKYKSPPSEPSDKSDILLCVLSSERMLLITIPSDQ